MKTVYSPIGLSSPVTFLNATVISFNGNLGLGAQESSLTVELVEDCDQQQIFADGLQDSIIGTTAYFPENSGGMAFSFNGIITNWNKNDSASGITYSVTLTDPRRLLENVSVIIDTYSGSVLNAHNVYNVYGSYEPQNSIIGGDCSVFGSSGLINDRGMPYSSIISKLTNWPGGLTIYSPTGYPLTVDLSHLPSGLPQYYRANGPAISLLQIITDVCEATGYEFYVYLDAKDIIRIGLISLQQNPGSFSWLQTYGGDAVIDRSFGRELRVEKQKTVIFGEKVHYLNLLTDMIPFFGENQACEAVTSVPGGECGYKVLVNTAPLAASLRNPGVFANAGNLYVHETDLRCNEELWKYKVLTDPDEYLSEFDLKAKQWLNAVGVNGDRNAALGNLSNQVTQSAKPKMYLDNTINNIGMSDAKLTQERINEDIKKIFGYIDSLKQTYYGKQFLGKLNENICYKQSQEIINSSNAAGQGCISSEMVYSAVPTNDGGWLEPGSSVMGVGDPYLGFFRQEDGRVGPFALFTAAGETPASDGTGSSGGTGGSGGTGNGGGYTAGGGGN
jgi:uncharacterized membrane protein YgcG